MVIGISDYDNLVNLKFCENDGNEITDSLSSCGYQISDHLFGYVAWEKMRDGIINFFTDLNINQSDILLFYYSGHGVLDADGDLFIATSQTDRNFPYKRGFSFNELAKLVRRTVASRVVVILDCCYSGSAQLGTAAIDYGSRILKGEGRCLLSASRAVEEAYSVEEENHSLYTFYVLQGLEGQDNKVFDHHGNITVDTLSSYVHEKFESLPTGKRPRQQPIKKMESSGDIIIVDKTYFPRIVRKASSKRKIDEKPKYHKGRTKTGLIEEGEPVPRVGTYSPGVNEDLIAEYRHKQSVYIRDVAKQNEDGRAFRFLEFIRDIFKDIRASYPHKLYPELEKYVTSNRKTVLIKGRIDALLGNVIIEFESDLKKYKENYEKQLKKYTAILWNIKEKIDYLCIATDGLEFLIFRPRSTLTTEFTVESITLEIVDTFDMRVEDPATVFKRLDRYMLNQMLMPPTGRDMVDHFGPDSIVLKDCMYFLKEAWQAFRGEISTIYQEWSKYLSIVYGGKIENEDLFLRHTYLASLAKLMVYTYYQKNVLPTSKQVIEKILTGSVFQEYGIENFLIEDFFSWVAKENVKTKGIDIANRIIDGLSRYDLTQLNEDIFKELYQQLVEPVERHELGEYYTPDWLAQKMVKELVTDVNPRVLDPACGSGTFLAATIRHKLNFVRDIPPVEKVKVIVQTVYGMDVHPLAVLISKANYLMGLGNLLSIIKEGSITIPVFMADSIIFPLPSNSKTVFGNEEGEGVYIYDIDKQTSLLLPKGLVAARSADSIIDSIKDFATKKARDQDTSIVGFKTNLQKSFTVSENQFSVLIQTIDTLVDLIRRNKDSIHPFVMKNIYKPSILGKFDIVIGNPPWLSYRFVRSIDRQQVLKEMITKKFCLIDTKDTKLLTQMELATLFLLRCAEFYLTDNGSIAFVLPRAIFTSLQHQNLRTNLFCGVHFGIEKIWDFDEFSPLFKVPACAIFGSKKAHSIYPINALNFSGKIKDKNIELAEFEKEVQSGNVTISNVSTLLLRIGTRTAWSYEPLNICGGKKLKAESSKYSNEFKQGATLTLRAYWLVDLIPHDTFGFNLREPYAQTSQRAIGPQGDQRHKDIFMSGRLESDYLYATLLGSDILPFCNLPCRSIFLPIVPSSGSYHVMDKEVIQDRGHNHAFEWLKEAEDNWKIKKGEEKAKRMSIYKRLDYHRLLTNQSPQKRFRVIFNRSGTFLSASVVDIHKTLSVSVDGNIVPLRGFVVDSTTHAYQTDNKKEAYYISAILNSSVVEKIIKPFQSRGLWGERDIYDLPFELPIPLYQDTSTQNKISRIGKTCTSSAKSKLTQLINRMNIDTVNATPNQIGRLRGLIGEALEVKIREIDKFVCDLITKK